jgi:hypothetical protein
MLGPSTIPLPFPKSPHGPQASRHYQCSLFLIYVLLPSTCFRIFSIGPSNCAPAFGCKNVKERLIACAVAPSDNGLHNVEVVVAVLIWVSGVMMMSSSNHLNWPNSAISSSANVVHSSCKSPRRAELRIHSPSHQVECWMLEHQVNP